MNRILSGQNNNICQDGDENQNSNYEVRKKRVTKKYYIQKEIPPLCDITDQVMQTANFPTSNNVIPDCRGAIRNRSTSLHNIEERQNKYRKNKGKASIIFQQQSGQQIAQQAHQSRALQSQPRMFVFEEKAQYNQTKENQIQNNNNNNFRSQNSYKRNKHPLNEYDRQQMDLSFGKMMQIKKQQKQLNDTNVLNLNYNHSKPLLNNNQEIVKKLNFEQISKILYSSSPNNSNKSNDQDAILPQQCQREQNTYNHAFTQNQNYKSLPPSNSNSKVDLNLLSRQQEQQDYNLIINNCNNYQQYQKEPMRITFNSMIKDILPILTLLEKGDKEQKSVEIMHSYDSSSCVTFDSGKDLQCFQQLINSLTQLAFASNQNCAINDNVEQYKRKLKISMDQNSILKQNLENLECQLRGLSSDYKLKEQCRIDELHQLYSSKLRVLMELMSNCSNRNDRQVESLQNELIYIIPSLKNDQLAKNISQFQSIANYFQQNIIQSTGQLQLQNNNANLIYTPQKIPQTQNQNNKGNLYDGSATFAVDRHERLDRKDRIINDVKSQIENGCNFNQLPLQQQNQQNTLDQHLQQKFQEFEQMARNLYSEVIQSKQQLVAMQRLQQCNAQNYMPINSLKSKQGSLSEQVHSSRFIPVTDDRGQFQLFSNHNSNNICTSYSSSEQCFNKNNFDSNQMGNNQNLIPAQNQQSSSTQRVSQGKTHLNQRLQNNNVSNDSRDVALQDIMKKLQEEYELSIYQ